MLSPYELKEIYTLEELFTEQALLKTIRTQLISGQSIQSTNTPDVGITFNTANVTIESISLAQRNVAAAIQLHQGGTFGNSLTKVKRYYTT